MSEASREMNLKEYINKLPLSHRAYKELADLVIALRTTVDRDPENEIAKKAIEEFDKDPDKF